MNQEAHDILNSVRIIDLQILRLLSKKKMLESCLYPSGIRYDIDKVQGSPENQLEKLTGEIFEVERRIRDLYSSKLDKAAEIEALINMVESEEYRTILMLRYIGHMSINKIAESMSYSPDWVYKKHRKAVDEVGKILKAREDCLKAESENP
jgi:DNA-directed RNA polymerase specialized sigma24 family protein